MEMVRKGIVRQIMSLLMVFAFAISLGVTAVSAQEAEEITPDQGFQSIILLQGQSASLTVSQTAPFGWNTFFVTSIGNATLSGKLTPVGTDALGWWTVMVIGARSRTFIDYAFGLVPWAGQSAIVDIPSPGYGIVLTTVFLTKMPDPPEPTEEDPDPESEFTYTVAIGQ